MLLDSYKLLFGSQPTLNTLECTVKTETSKRTEISRTSVSPPFKISVCVSIFPFLMVQEYLSNSDIAAAKYLTLSSYIVGGGTRVHAWCHDAQEGWVLLCGLSYRKSITCK